MTSTQEDGQAMDGMVGALMTLRRQANVQGHLILVYLLDIARAEAEDLKKEAVTNAGVSAGVRRSADLHVVGASEPPRPE